MAMYRWERFCPSRTNSTVKVPFPWNSRGGRMAGWEDWVGFEVRRPGFIHCSLGPSSLGCWASRQQYGALYRCWHQHTDHPQWLSTLSSHLKMRRQRCTSPVNREPGFWPRESDPKVWTSCNYIIRPPKQITWVEQSVTKYSKSGFPNPGAMDTWGNIILHCGGLSCTLQDV